MSEKPSMDPFASQPLDVALRGLTDDLRRDGYVVAGLLVGIAAERISDLETALAERTRERDEARVAWRNDTFRHLAISDALDRVTYLTAVLDEVALHASARCEHATLEDWASAQTNCLERILDIAGGVLEAADEDVLANTRRLAASESREQRMREALEEIAETECERAACEIGRKPRTCIEREDVTRVEYCPVCVAVTALAGEEGEGK